MTSPDSKTVTVKGVVTLQTLLSGRLTHLLSHSLIYQETFDLQ